MRRAAAILLAIWCALVPNVAVAETDVERARTLYLRGVELTKQSRFEEAIEVFEESLELDPLNTTRNNLAYSYFQTGNLVKAANLYQRIIDDADEESNPKALAYAKDTLRDIDKKVGRVEVRALASGIIKLNGKRINADRLYRVEAGTLTVTLDGEDNFKETRRLRAGQRINIDIGRKKSVDEKDELGKFVVHVRADVEPASKLNILTGVGGGYRVGPIEPYAGVLLGGGVNSDFKFGIEAGGRYSIGGQFGGVVDIAGHVLFIDGTNPGGRGFVGAYARFSMFEIQAGFGASIITGLPDNFDTVSLLVPVTVLGRF